MDTSTSNKALKTLQMKNIYLEDKKAVVRQLNFDDKLVYASYLLAQDEATSYDGVTEMKGELAFNSDSFEDGLESTSKNHE